MTGNSLPLKSINISRPLEIVAMDFVRPLQISEKGNIYALVMVDDFTAWPIIYKVDDIEADTVQRKLKISFIHMDALRVYCQTEGVILLPT